MQQAMQTLMTTAGALVLLSVLALSAPRLLALQPTQANPSAKTPVQSSSTPPESGKIMRDYRGSELGMAADGYFYRLGLKMGIEQIKQWTEVFRLGQQVASKHRAGEKYKDHAWFVSFAPRDKPEIASVVLCENCGFGGVHPAPKAKGIYEAWSARRLNASVNLPDALKVP